jgi:hypothetical protein
MATGAPDRESLLLCADHEVEALDFFLAQRLAYIAAL